VSSGSLFPGVPEISPVSLGGRGTSKTNQILRMLGEAVRQSPYVSPGHARSQAHSRCTPGSNNEAAEDRAVLKNHIPDPADVPRHVQSCGLVTQSPTTRGSGAIVHDERTNLALPMEGF
jgi:hypothetical protein